MEWKTLLKWMIWGYHHFWKPPYTHTQMPHLSFFLVIFSGVDFPAVDWVVQLDCPDSVDSYIHRVGRTARYESPGAHGGSWVMGAHGLVWVGHIEPYEFRSLMNGLTAFNSCVGKELTIQKNLWEEVSKKRPFWKYTIGKRGKQLWHRISGALQKMSFWFKWPMFKGLSTAEALVNLHCFYYRPNRALLRNSQRLHWLTHAGRRGKHGTFVLEMLWTCVYILCF